MFAPPTKCYIMSILRADPTIWLRCLWRVIR